MTSPDRCSKATFPYPNGRNTLRRSSLFSTTLPEPPDDLERLNSKGRTINAI
jgi:hypothetical protein